MGLVAPWAWCRRGSSLGAAVPCPQTPGACVGTWPSGPLLLLPARPLAAQLTQLLVQSPLQLGPLGWVQGPVLSPAAGIEDPFPADSLPGVGASLLAAAVDLGRTESRCWAAWGRERPCSSARQRARGPREPQREVMESPHGTPSPHMLPGGVGLCTLAGPAAGAPGVCGQKMAPPDQPHGPCATWCYLPASASSTLRPSLVTSRPC